MLHLITFFIFMKKLNILIIRTGNNTYLGMKKEIRIRMLKK